MNDDRSSRRRLTARQTAVLAAVERLDRPTLRDLRGAFPSLAASEIHRVLLALGRKGKVDWAGDEAKRYLGRVTYWSTALEPTDVPEALQYLYEDLDAGNQLYFEMEADPHRETVTILLPLKEVARFLQGEESEGITLLRRRLRLLLGGARFQPLRIWPEQREDWHGVPVLVLELGLPRPDHRTADGMT